MIKIGFIGFGRFAKHRLTILQSIPGVTFVGYFDPNEEMDSKISIERFEKVDDLLGQVDAVIVSVPPRYAPEYSKLALSNGIHVFCEKPPSINISDLNKLDHFSNKLVLAYGFNHRLHDSVMEIKKTIESQEMGSILWMRGRYGKEVSADYKDDWRCNRNMNGGGILIDQGIHLLDIMDWLAGGFDVNQSILSDTYLNINKVEDNAFINLYSTKNQISASLHSTITQWRYLFSLEIFLEMGSITLNGLRTSSGRYGKEVLTIRPERHGSYKGETCDREFMYDVNNSWKREMDAFIGSIKMGVPYPYSSLHEAKNIMSLLGDIYSNAIWVHR